jgi:hypothetical protein
MTVFSEVLPHRSLLIGRLGQDSRLYFCERFVLENGISPATMLDTYPFVNDFGAFVIQYG